MRDHHRTPQSEGNRRSSSKNLSKATKKSLNSVFTSISEEASHEADKKLTDISSFSEISVANQSSDTAESFIFASGPPISAGSDRIMSGSNLFSKTAAEKFCTVNVPRNPCASIEANVISDLLRQARAQVLSSSNADSRSKKLLDALIQMIIDEFYSLPEEKDIVAELLEAKTLVILICLLVWFLVLALAFLPGSLGHGSFRGPLPT